MPHPSSTIEALRPLHPESYSTPPSHHVGNPPSSFTNPWPSFQSAGFSQAAKTRLSTPTNFVPVPHDRAGLVEIQKPDFGVSRDGLKATWIGHASFLVEITKQNGAERGIRILLDPVWSDRVGPYGIVGPVRFTPPPCTIEELPFVDAVCISHDHYDHLDSHTLKKINAKQKGDLRIFCGLKVKSVLLGLGIGLQAGQITEMDWWDRVSMTLGDLGAVELICSPAQHRSGRALWNLQGTLWCSWIVKEVTAGNSNDAKRLYFAGEKMLYYIS